MLVQVLDNSKEYIENQVNSKEGLITKTIANDQKNTDENLTVSQHNRNRGIVKEIISTCVLFREEIGKEIENLRGPDDYWFIESYNANNN